MRNLASSVYRGLDSASLAHHDPFGRMARRQLQTAGLGPGDIVIIQWNGNGAVNTNKGNFAFM